MRLIVSILYLFIFGQVLFLETFDDGEDAITGVDDIWGVVWNTITPGSIAATDYYKIVGGKLEARDTNSPGAEWETEDIDVAICSGFAISLDIWTWRYGSMCWLWGTGTICIDWIKVEYNLDGLGWVEVGTEACPPTMIFAPGTMVQTGDIGGTGTLTYTSPCIDFGTTLKVRVSCQCWAATEFWEVDNVSVFCNSCVLPVEFGGLFASKLENDALLDWSTLSEYSNHFFEIERSYDGINFEIIGQQTGAGNSVSKINYQFLDQSVRKNPLVYYRLSQVDFDGKKRF